MIENKAREVGFWKKSIIKVTKVFRKLKLKPWKKTCRYLGLQMKLEVAKGLEIKW